MNFNKPFHVLPTLILVVAWLVSGCSASSESVAPDAQPLIVSSASEANNDNDASNENIDATDVETDTEIVIAEMLLEDEVDETVNNSPAVVDPLVQNKILVTFEITVPFYLSNELRVELIWGEFNLTAMWVGGQFWSATGELPTETEHSLTINFYDKNGDIELARFSNEYRTGSNATEPIQILAEQFDANQFDSDGDGVNNLVELNAGTDPLVDQDSLLEIVDAFALSNSYSQYSRISASHIFESLVQQSRPYVDAFEAESFLNTRLFGKFSINIDADGNGTIDVNSDEAPRRFLPRLSATRHNSGNSISWAGELITSDSEYVHRENVTSTVSKLDGNLRSFVQEITGRNAGTYQFSWDTSANVTGELIEDSSLCKPVAGTVVYTRHSNYSGHSTNTTDTKTIVTTASKEIDDLYWRVVTLNNVSETTEYFARELKIVHDLDDEEKAFFTCDFVDF